ncbi:hypothetical protein D3C78_1531850 [compost metagenome]
MASVRAGASLPCPRSKPQLAKAWRRVVRLTCSGPKALATALHRLGASTYMNMPDR